jgi:hypothetical protein
LKILQVSKKTLSIGSTLLGAMLVLSPSLNLVFAASTFHYTNPGNRVYLNVTNNQNATSFTINATQITAFMTWGTDMVQRGNLSYIGGFQVLMAGNLTCAGASGFCYANGTYWSDMNMTTQAYFENQTSYVNALLAALSSTYLVTGTGPHDNVTILAGITPDIYSVVLPGNNGTVGITQGTGSSTYAIQVGPNSAINILPGKYMNSTGTESVFNIVYGNNIYGQ